MRWEDFYEQVAVHRDDLAEIVEVDQPSNRPPRSPAFPIAELSSAAVRLLAQYSSELRLVVRNNQPHIRFPKSFQLRQDQWKLLSRHVFTGKTIGCVEETVSIDSDLDYLIKLPGRSLREVIDRCGIAETKPLAYDGSNLLFSSIHVKDASKLSCHHSQLKLLGGRILRCAGQADSIDCRFGPERTEVSDWWRFPLHKAAEAGIIPKEGVVTVDAALKYLYLPKTQINISSLNRPLKYRSQMYEPVGLLCPLPLIRTCLLPSAKAVRAYRIPSEVQKYTVRTLDPTTAEEVDLPGKYFQLSDLASLPARDIRQERADRKARDERLIARYGPDLPADYQQFTDEDLETYYRIKELVAQGEIVPTTGHPLLPQPKYWCGDFLEWIKEVAPDRVVTCPITKQKYLRSIAGMDELAKLPGFWAAVERTLGQTSWVRSLILEPSVRAAALAHAI